jgi:hypothetical protein
MKLYLLRPILGASTIWKPCHDKAFGFVIRAEDIGQARRIAQENHGDEGYAEPWLTSKLTSCELLTGEGEEGVIIRDFSAG